MIKKEIKILIKNYHIIYTYNLRFILRYQIIRYINIYNKMGKLFKSVEKFLEQAAKPIYKEFER
jgi:hypothetical protein